MPEQEEQRLIWLRQGITAEIRPRADRYRKELVAAHGQERGCQIESAEVYEIGEYGRRWMLRPGNDSLPFFSLKMRILRKAPSEHAQAIVGMYYADEDNESVISYGDTALIIPLP